MVDASSSSASMKKQTPPPLPSSPALSPLGLPPLPSSPVPPMSSNPNPGNCFDELIVQNAFNFEKSTSITQFMFYHCDNYWEDFPSEVMEPLRSGFAEHRPMMLLEIEGEKHAFDFLRMVQVNLMHRTLRSIAWANEEGRYFFPKQFLNNDNVILPEVGYSLQMVNDGDDVVRPTNKGKRKIEQYEGLEVAESGNVKRNYGYLGSNKRMNLSLNLTINSDSKHLKFPNTKPLKLDDKSYIYFSNMFISKIFKHDPHAIVTGVHKVGMMVPPLKARWLEFRRQVEVTKAERGETNIVYAWYATTKEEVASILCNGFSLPLESSELPHVIKGAMYLASLSSPNYSAIQTQVEKNGEEKHVILCRVLLGSVERVHLELEQMTPSREEFDTGADHPENPKWYVVWKEDINKRILPMCVVTCKTTAINPVNLPAHYRENSVIHKLVLEMKQQVPLSNVQLIDSLFDALKNRRMSKSVFMKHMRDITGDHMLLTSVRETTDGK